MCVNDCSFNGVCVNAVCQCYSPYTGNGEGTNPNNCQLNALALQILWVVVLVTSVGAVTVSTYKLRGLCGGNNDWSRLTANITFQSILSTFCIGLFWGLYAIVRTFAGSYAFNDYLGTVFIVIALSFNSLRGFLICKFFMILLNGLLKAGGGVQMHGGWRWYDWLVWPICFPIFLPLLGSPALEADERIIMVRYFLFSLAIIVFLMGVKLIATISWAEHLLKTVSPSTARTAKKKLNRFLATYFCAGMSMVSLSVVTSTAIFEYFPYYLVIIAWISLAMPISATMLLSLDPADFQRRARTPKASANDDLPSRTESSGGGLKKSRASKNELDHDLQDAGSEAHARELPEGHDSPQIMPRPSSNPDLLAVPELASGYMSRVSSSPDLLAVPDLPEASGNFGAPRVSSNPDFLAVPEAASNFILAPLDKSERPSTDIEAGQQPLRVE